MKKRKITFLISLIDKSLAFEWIATHLDKSKFDLSFILYTPGKTRFEEFLNNHGITVKNIRYSGKKDIPLALIKTIFYLLKTSPDVIHTHLFDASLIGLTAGKITGIKKRILTRHHSTIHHHYFKSAVKYDQYCNRLATNIIAISDVVRNVLIEEGADQKKIITIHHGFDLKQFQNVEADRIEILRKKYSIPQGSAVIGVVSRFVNWKGIQYIIPAFKEYLKYNPTSVLILANAKGPYTDYLLNQLKDIPDSSYRVITFEKDIPALYALFNAFVHTPIDKSAEAFGQTYVEALAAGIPSIFTLSGIAAEFIRNKENALVVPFEDSTAILNALKEYDESEELKATVIREGRRDVIKLFTLEGMISALTRIYE